MAGVKRRLTVARLYEMANDKTIADKEKLIYELMRQWGAHRLPRLTERRVARRRRNNTLRRKLDETGSLRAAADALNLSRRQAIRVTKRDFEAVPRE